MEAIGKLHAPAALLPGKSPCSSLDSSEYFPMATVHVETSGCIRE
jgi:hypothetical protein